MSIEQQALADRLTGEHAPVPDTLVLALDGLRIGVRSNSGTLLARLAEYFAQVVSAGAVDIELLAIESEPVALGLDYVDWRREAGKRGRKDSCFDLPGARVIHKVRTGMTFLQSDAFRIAAGPCLANDNQVINFINNQYMNWLQQQGWLNCHAAALTVNGRALAMAGFSGGGKSTLMLHMLEQQGTAFLSNDRLFISQQQGQICAAGIPKLPRINPGTIVNNPRLHTLIPPLERAELARLPTDQLWELEQKYDADISRLYGPGRIDTHSRPLAAFMVLNWSRTSDQPLQVERVDPGRRPDLLAAIMKSPGPFYQNSEGQFQTDTRMFDEAAYLRLLEQVPVYEARGGIDFNALSSRYLELAG